MERKLHEVEEMGKVVDPRTFTDRDLDRLFPRSKPLGERLNGNKGWFAGFIIASRAGFRCEICGADEFPLEVDHRKPVAKGGRANLRNLRALCYFCNRDKGTMSEEDFRKILRRRAEALGRWSAKNPP